MSAKKVVVVAVDFTSLVSNVGLTQVENSKPLLERPFETIKVSG